MAVTGPARADDSIDLPGRYTLTLHPSIPALNCRSGPGKEYPAIEWLKAGVVVDVKEVHATPEVWARTQWGCFIRARARYLAPTTEPPTAVTPAAGAPRKHTAAVAPKLWPTGTYAVRTASAHGKLNCRARPSTDAAIFAVYDNGSIIHVSAVSEPGDPWMFTSEECYVKASKSYLTVVDRNP